MVKDINTGSSTSSTYGPNYLEILYSFQGYDLTNGHALWKSDGTSTAGTHVMVKDSLKLLLKL